ncbi:PilZ domain-containing protein [Treponema sp. R80B11-R83G3]
MSDKKVQSGSKPEKKDEVKSADAGKEKNVQSESVPEKKDEVKPADAGKDESTQSESTAEQKAESAQGESAPEKKVEVINTEIVGKKVFFLCPSVQMQNQIMDELTQLEFEIYAVKDSARLTRVLKKYNDSIVYVNLDDNAYKSELEKWIEVIHTSVPTVKLGVFSSNTDEEYKNKFVNKLNVTCGFINLKLDMNRAAQKISETLDSLNVKGRRKYLRASTEHETTATINLPHDGNFIKGTIKDVSVVGISCVFNNDPGLKAKTLYKDIQIRLQSMLLKAEAVVFGSRTDGDKIYVLIFNTQRISPDVRAKIRKYIQQNLQHRMDSELK